MPANGSSLTKTSAYSPALPSAVPVNWVLIALLSQTAWGGYPVFARYFQNTVHIPSLVALSNGVAALALAIFVLPHMDLRFVKSRSILVFSIVLILRSVTNIYAARYTLAVYVQLINLMSPFLVAALSRTWLREPLPRFTVPAVVLSVLGAVFMSLADLGRNGIVLAITPTDWFGISLALASTFFLALYVLTIRRSLKGNVSADGMSVVQSFVLFISMGAGSLLFREDWTPWTQMPLSDWGLFAAFALGVLLMGMKLQNASLKHLSASFYSTVQAWRLVSTLGLAALILGEWLSSGWQVLGALIVMATISWYSWVQNSHAVPPVEA